MSLLGIDRDPILACDEFETVARPDLSGFHRFGPMAGRDLLCPMDGLVEARFARGAPQIAEAILGARIAPITVDIQ